MDERAQQLLWNELISAESLEKIAQEVLHGSKVRGRDGMQPTRVLRDRMQISQKLSHKLKDCSYTPVGYRSKLKSKGARSAPRQVSIPAARDRAVIKSVHSFLKQCFPEINPPLPQNVIARLVNALESGGFKYFVRVDIQNFYPSIDHKYILSKVSGRVAVPNAIKVVERIIETATTADNISASSGNIRGVPQGLAVSSLLSEIAMSELDTHMRLKAGIFYCRYVDDVLILSNRIQHRKLFGEISKLVDPVGLLAHPMDDSGSKTTHGQLDKGVEYLGYKLGGQRNSPSVRKSSVQALERKIAKLFADYRKGPHNINPGFSSQQHLEYNLNLTISGCVFGGHKRGWLQYYSLMRDFSLLHRLDNFVQKQMKKYALNGKIGTKSFVKAFRFAARRALDDSGYVPNFDRINLTGRRNWLSTVAGFSQAEVRKMGRAQVDREFDFQVGKLLNDMEEDLAIAY